MKKHFINTTYELSRNCEKMPLLIFSPGAVSLIRVLINPPLCCCCTDLYRWYPGTDYRFTELTYSMGIPSKCNYVYNIFFVVREKRRYGTASPRSGERTNPINPRMMRTRGARHQEYIKCKLELWTQLNAFLFWSGCEAISRGPVWCYTYKTLLLHSCVRVRTAVLCVCCWHAIKSTCYISLHVIQR